MNEQVLLIMDDDSNLLLLLHEYFTKIFKKKNVNFKIICAEKGETLLNKLNDEMKFFSFNEKIIALLDLTIVNGMGGIETAKNLQRINKNIEIYGMTGDESYLNDKNVKLIFKKLFLKPLFFYEIEKIIIKNEIH